MPLQAGDSLPLFSVTSRVDGSRVDYRTIWQRRNLVLVSLPAEDESAGTLLAALQAPSGGLAGDDVRLVVTADAIAGVPSPGVIVADRWGEIHFIAGAADVARLPPAAEILEWLQYVRQVCPECEGEAW